MPTIEELERRIAELERDLSRPKTTERDAARAARNDRVEEVVLLLAWLTRMKGIEAHLVPIPNQSANATMNHVVCLHHGSERLVWRLSDVEVLAYFGHLKQQDCARGLSRTEKMAYLANMLSAK